MNRFGLALFALLLPAPAAAETVPLLDAGLIVFQGKVEALDDASLTLSGVGQVLLLDARNPEQVARLQIAAFETGLWGKAGPFATAAPQAAITAASLDTLTLISIAGAKVEGGRLVLSYGLDLGERPQVGETALFSLAGPVEDGGQQGGTDQAAPAAGAAPAGTTSGKQGPLGIRVHNPLDIRPLSLPDRWDGQIGLYHTSDAAFVIFEDFPYGLRAAAHLLRNYQLEHGIRTLLGKDGYQGEDGIITRWSPARDHNDTHAYVARVSRLTGFAPDQELDLEDGRTVAAILEAMTRVELGLADDGPLPWSDGAMQSALELAEFE